VTTGSGVDGFTLDARTGEFALSHRTIQTPMRGKTYSVNEGNTSRWTAPVRRYIEYLQTPDSATGRPYAARYVGSLVADVHRTLLDGGVFLYPGEARGPRADGKLRLLYEAAPMALIAEQAGGRASTGTRRILEIEASSLHQRVPLIIGSRDDVTAAEDFIAGRRG
jgi:fructose-1,6-bisphosphatase I